MTDIRDELGRPIQLTDEFGRPVQLTDEHGSPIHLTGVATTVGSELHNKTTHDQATQTMGSEVHGGTHFAPTPVDYVKHGAAAVAGAVAGVGEGDAGVSHTEAHVVKEDKKQQLERSTSSSSNSSEDDGQGGRRKMKKGLVQKIKEKLPGHGDHKEKAGAHSPSTDTKISTTTVEHHEKEREKKGFFDKIKDKLPGHH